MICSTPDSNLSTHRLDRDVFIRELLSNSNDALEKTRLISLTDPTILTTATNLNITVRVDEAGRRIVIRGELATWIAIPTTTADSWTC